MNERVFYQVLTIGLMVLAGIAGVASIWLVITTALDFSLTAALGTTVMGGVTVGSIMGSIECAKRTGSDNRVFSNEAEREVLTPRQRKELRKARGEVVMERALIDVEHERQNIVHELHSDSHDEETPPYQTEFGKQAGFHPGLPAIRARERERREEYGR